MKIYTVGGAVRDELLGLNPQDFDYVVVDGSHEEMIAAGYTQVGADFPVYLHPETNDEYALARVERKSGDGYLGFSVKTKDVTLEEDLSRRDLTINAMAKDLLTGEIFDPFNGRADLESKILRHVSDAFAEDPLRVVRLGRFFTRYSDFTVAPETQQLAFDMVLQGELNHLPVERFWAELQKVFRERPCRFFDFMGSVNADVHVNFFAELYATFDVAKLSQVKGVANAAVRLLPHSDCVMVHTALTATGGKTLATAETRTQVLHKNVNALRKAEPTAEGLFELLKQVKAWSVGHGVSDLISAMDVGNYAGEDFVFTSQQLQKAVEVTKFVTSAMFPQFAGKELGAAIEAGRKTKIAELLKDSK